MRNFRRRRLPGVTLALVAALAAHAAATAQTPAPDVPAVDSLTADSLAAVVLAADSLATRDSLPPDSLAATRIAYAVSPDALEDQVSYSVRDSMHYSVAEQRIYLYGDAEVRYQDIVLRAGRMVIDNRASIVTAEPRLDSAGAAVEKPSFEQGAQAFTAEGLRYNFKTRKGIITNARTTQGDLYVLGGKTKLVAAKPGDAARVDNTVYNSDAIFTTCDLDHPHFGIRSNRQKVIPGKQVIVGPSNLELGGVPTPLWLPFGFFPIGSSERSGLLFPTNYQYEPDQGFGFQDIGWYFPWNDNVHSEFTTDLYLKGTVRLKTVTNYNKRYRYRGNLSASYARLRGEVNGVETFSPGVTFAWTHAQDPKANPFVNFRANANFQTNNYAQNNVRTFDAQFTTIYRSNIAATFRFPEHPSWNLTAGLDHSQNTQTRAVTVNFPSARFSTGQIYPFANAGGPGQNAWYKKAVIDYQAQFRGTVNATDTTLFDAETWREALLGGQHSASFSAPVNLLRHFRLSPSVSVQQTLFFDEFSRVYDPVVDTLRDTVFVDGVPVDFLERLEVTPRVRDSLNSGFSAATSVQASLGLSTNIYGTARFRLGPLRGVRHIITPSVNIGYTPDYSARPFNYYATVQSDEVGGVEEYLRFPRQPFSAGSLPDQLSLRVGYGFGNRIETKIQGRNDSVPAIRTLINNLRFSGSYDLAADSLAWSPISVSGAQLTLLKKLVRVTASGQFDVYALDDDGRRVDETLRSRGEGLVRLARATVTLNAGMTLGQLRDLVAGREIKTTGASIYSLVERFRVSYNYARSFRGGRAEPWTTTANTVNASGTIPLTSKWSISGITLGYDFRNRSITYPSLGVARDLHCWVMDFRWVPTFRSFNFSIRVKPGSLGFLDLPYRRGIQY